MRTLSYIMSSSDSESQSTSIVILAISRSVRDVLLVNNLEEECRNTVDAVSINFAIFMNRKILYVLRPARC